jgi:hypothetical protein
MNIKKRWKGDRYQDESGSRQASEVFNIKNESVYLNHNYDLEILQNMKISENGLLICGKLRPKTPSLPEFWFRWDEKQQELDIDMHGDIRHREDWNNSRNGYEGHHTEKVINGGRNFKVSIKIPNSVIFQGVLSFNLKSDVEIVERLRIYDSVKIELIKNDKKSP